MVDPIAKQRFYRPGKFLLICLLMLLVACSEGGSNGIYGVSGCAIAQQNEIVHKALLDRYYWYDRVADSIDYAAFSSPQQTLDYLRYATLDRFSYITSQASFNSFINNGTYLGYGFSYVVAADDRVWIRFVYTQSAAASAGMQRGDEVLAINGQSVASIIAADSWDSIFGPAQAGVPLTIQLRRKSALVETLQLNKGTVAINTVLHSAVIPGGANTIGYLVFNNFLNTSAGEFAPVFAQFKAAGVDQLILDLRYNGGGSVNVGRELASYIKSTASADTELYVELRNNGKHQADNFSFYFLPRANSLGLNEVTVITSELTCSASEQLISGLQPYFNRVTTIGSASCGKPVGMNPLEFCDASLLAVNFASFNASQQGDYYVGIAADCSAVDDVGFDLGDPNEPMLRAARYYVENQSCLLAPRQASRRQPQWQGMETLIGAV